MTLTKVPPTPDGEKYSLEEYNLVQQEMARLNLNWVQLAADGKSGRSLLDAIDRQKKLTPQVKEGLFRQEIRQEEEGLDDASLMKQKKKDEQLRKQKGRKTTAKRVVSIGTLVIVAISAFLVFAQPSCSKPGKVKKESTVQVIGKRTASIETIPRETTTEYWWVSKNITFYGLLALSVVGALGIILLVAYHKRKDSERESPGVARRRNLSIWMLVLTLMLLFFLAWQTFLAKNRNTVREKFPPTVDIGSAREEALKDSMRVAFTLNPVRDSVTLRKLEDALTEVAFWRIKSRDDSIRYMAERKGIDSAAMGTLRATLRWTRDSAQRAIDGVVGRLNSSDSFNRKLQATLHQKREDSVKMDAVNRSLKQKLELERIAAQAQRPKTPWWITFIVWSAFLVGTAGVLTYLFRIKKRWVLILSATFLIGAAGYGLLVPPSGVTKTIEVPDTSSKEKVRELEKKLERKDDYIDSLEKRPPVLVVPNDSTSTVPPVITDTKKDSVKAGPQSRGAKRQNEDKNTSPAGQKPAWKEKLRPQN